MITWIKLACKGAVMGLANVIPGVSGGTMAVVMGIYDKLIHCVTHLRKEWKESIKFLIPLLIGLVIGIVGLSYLITFLFERFPVQTNFLFIGLIVGGLPMIIGKVKATGKKINIGHLVVGIIFFAVVVGLSFVAPDETAKDDMVLNVIEILKLFGVGVVASATMVIPGVSGSMIMKLMGYYLSIISEIKGFMNAVFAFDMQGILHGIAFLAPFGIGILVGVALIAKIIETLFEKAVNYVYLAILGLIFASPIAIVAMSDLSAYNVISVLTGLVTAAIGFFVALKLGKE